MISDSFNVFFGMTYVLVLITINSRIKDIYRLIDQKGFSVYKNREIMKIYSHIQDILKNSNIYFSFNSLAAFSNYIFFLFFIIFAFYDAFMRNFQFDNFWFFLGGLFQQFETGTLIICLMIFAENLRENGKRISRKIDQKTIFDCSKSRKFSQIFNLQNSYELIGSCGLFDFGPKMIFVLISTSFAYLIVAIQFDIMLS